MKARPVALVTTALLAMVVALSAAPLLGAEAGDQDKPERRSKLVTNDELAALIPKVLPGAVRVALVRLKTREVLVGFGEEGHRPVALAALGVVRDKRRKGTMVVAVGVKREDEKDVITRLVTFPPKGNLHDLKKYKAKQAKFLKQFNDRPVKRRVGKVDLVTGATYLCKWIRRAADNGLLTIRKLRAKPHVFPKLAERSWEVAPPAEKPAPAGEES